MGATSDVALSRNPNTGRMNLQWVNGDVVFDDTCEHEVMSRLVEKRATWWADEAGTHGSRIYTITHIDASTQSDADAYAREALQPMVDAKRIEIVNVTVDVVPPTLGARFVVNVFWKPRGANTPKQAQVFV